MMMMKVCMSDFWFSSFFLCVWLFPPLPPTSHVLVSAWNTLCPSLKLLFTSYFNVTSSCCFYVFMSAFSRPHRRPDWGHLSYCGCRLCFPSFFVLKPLRLYSCWLLLGNYYCFYLIHSFIGINGVFKAYWVSVPWMLTHLLPFFLYVNRLLVEIWILQF